MGTYYCVQTSLRGLGPAQGGSQGPFGSTIRSTSLWHENATRPIRTDGTTNGTTDGTDGIPTTAILLARSHAPTKILRRPTPGHETRRCTPLGPTRPKAHATQLWWRTPNGPWWSKTSKQQNDGRTSHGTQPMAMPMNMANMAAMAQARPGLPPNAAAQAGARPNFKYTSGMRNVAGAPVMPGQQQPQMVVPQQQQQQQQPQPPQAAVFVQGQEPLTASMLAQAPPSEQKQMLGERLFPLIQGLFPDMAGKITGMLLEIDNSELVHMLEHKESLSSKVEEAVAVLSAHKTTPE